MQLRWIVSRVLPTISRLPGEAVATKSSQAISEAMVLPDDTAPSHTSNGAVACATERACLGESVTDMGSRVRFLV
jgi:hypothetical protein